jgi:hypothetical protein
MTRTTPLRRMILQLRQIFFTEANTFISTSRQISHRGSCRAAGYSDASDSCFLTSDP